MKTHIKKYNIVGFIILFIGIPTFIYATGDFPRRSFFKESISMMVILAFFFMIGQFFLNRGARGILKDHKMAKVVKWHKFIGYVFVNVLLIHPFLIVVPRFFEAGIDPMEAFVTIITTFSSKGVVFGLMAWVLMLMIGLTSMFRDKLPFNYKVWRVVHGVMALFFMIIAAFHMIDLGRHANSIMIVYVILILSLSIYLLMKVYFEKSANIQVK